MELQDAPATYLFKLWPWIETNRIRIISGAGLILAGVGLFSFYSWQRQQKEITAGNEFTQIMVSDPRTMTSVQQASLYLKLAKDNPNTSAGQRALLQSATTLFDAGQYADAQNQFQQFIQQYPDNALAGQAALGLAASLDTQGKTDLAAAAYQRVVNYSDPMAATYAKYSLAQIDERQGKLADALNLYEDVARSNPNSTLASEAGMHAMELRTKQPPPSSTAAPLIPKS